MNILVFLIWWIGYSLTLFYFIPNRRELPPEEIMVPTLKSIFWPITVPVIIYFKWKEFRSNSGK